MTTARLRWGCVGLLTILTACSDTTEHTIQAPSAKNDSGDLALTLHAVNRVQSSVTNQVQALSASAVRQHLRSPRLAQAASASSQTSEGVILRTNADAGFSIGFGRPYAYGQAIVDYFANAARQTVALDLQRRGVPIGVPIVTEEHTHPFIGWYGFTTNNTVFLRENCGHSVRANTTHRVWNQNQLPAGPSNPFLSDEVPNQSPMRDQSTCPPERHEEQEVLPGGSGGGEKQTDEDQWYLCTFEVWYNQYGAEISRTLLYCYPM